MQFIKSKIFFNFLKFFLIVFFIFENFFSYTVNAVTPTKPGDPCSVSDKCPTGLVCDQRNGPHQCSNPCGPTVKCPGTKKCRSDGYCLDGIQGESCDNSHPCASAYVCDARYGSMQCNNSCTWNNFCPNELKCQSDGRCISDIDIININNPKNLDEGATKFTPQVTIGSFIKGIPQKFTTNDTTMIGHYIREIYKYFIGISGIIAVVVIMVAGLIWLISGGSQEKISQAKNLINGAISGLILLLLSYFILLTINPDLVNFKTSQTKNIEQTYTPKTIGCCEVVNMQTRSCSQINFAQCEKIASSTFTTELFCYDKGGQYSYCREKHCCQQEYNNGTKKCQDRFADECLTKKYILNYTSDYEQRLFLNTKCDIKTGECK